MISLVKKSARKGYTPTRRPLPPSEARKKAEASKNILMIAAVAILTVLAVWIGYPHVKNLANEVKPDLDTACYGLPSQKYTASFIDYSTTHLFSSPEHSVALKTNFMNVYPLLSPNQKLEVFTTEKKTTSNVVAPYFSVCRPASTVVQHEALKKINPNIEDKSLAQLTYTADKAKADYETNIDRIMEESQSSGNNEFWNSPILHRLKGISRYYKDRDIQLDELTIFSDGIENSSTVHFCQKKDHLPSWENFKKRRIYREIKPFDSFKGTKITFLMPDVVDRYNLGPYCTQDEIEDFWRSYFLEVGAREVDIQSIGAMSYLELGVMLASVVRLFTWQKNKVAG